MDGAWPCHRHVRTVHGARTIASHALVSMVSHEMDGAVVPRPPGLVMAAAREAAGGVAARRRAPESLVLDQVPAPVSVSVTRKAGKLGHNQGQSRSLSLRAPLTERGTASTGNASGRKKKGGRSTYAARELAQQLQEGEGNLSFVIDCVVSSMRGSIRHKSLSGPLSGVHSKGSTRKKGEGAVPRATLPRRIADLVPAGSMTDVGGDKGQTVGAPVARSKSKGREMASGGRRQDGTRVDTWEGGDGMSDVMHLLSMAKSPTDTFFGDRMPGRGSPSSRSSGRPPSISERVDSFRASRSRMSNSRPCSSRSGTVSPSRQAADPITMLLEINDELRSVRRDRSVATVQRVIGRVRIFYGRSFYFWAQCFYLSLYVFFLCVLFCFFGL